MATYKLNYMKIETAQNGKKFVEFDADKFQVGDVLVFEDVQKARRGRKAGTTRYTLVIEGIGEQYMSNQCAAGEFKAQRYYGEVNIEQVA